MSYSVVANVCINNLLLILISQSITTYIFIIIFILSLTEAGVLYIHVHGAKNLRSHSSRTLYDPYCLVKHGERSIFKTHTIFGTTDPIWEKGVEILIPSCRDVSLSFDIFHNSRGLGSHDLLGSTNLRLNRVSLLYFYLLYSTLQSPYLYIVLQYLFIIINITLIIGSDTVNPAQNPPPQFNETKFLPP